MPEAPAVMMTRLPASRGGWRSDFIDVGVVGVEVDDGRAGLKIGIDGLDSVLPSQATQLEPAVRNGGANEAVGVDPDRSRLYLRRDPMRASDAGGPETGGETVFGIVGH